MKTIDLRSDTVTLPTPEMRRAMYEAEVGDDTMGEDPTTRRLEIIAARRMGKEDAALVASGTMGNLVCVLAHCQRGDEMIVGNTAHIFRSEVGGVSGLGSVHVHTVPDGRGLPDPGDVEGAIRGNNIHWPPTTLVCLENTHNRASGVVSTPEEIGAIAEVARDHGAAVHLDGARIFNAEVYLGIPSAELVKDVDSVTFCLSKGLACPIGSLVCGSYDFIQRVRKYRQMLGGAMRQVGVIAAAGIVGLETMVDRMAEDHENARRLAGGLAQMPGIVIDPSQIKTNIVIFEWKDGSAHQLTKFLGELGVLCNAYPGTSEIRMVTHYGLHAEDIDAALEAMEAATKPANSTIAGTHSSSNRQG